MKLNLKYYFSLACILLFLNAITILLVHRYLIHKGKVRVSIQYQTFEDEDLSLYWNDGRGFSDQNHQTLNARISIFSYDFEIENTDSVTEIRIDPDSKFELALLKKVSIEGLAKPLIITDFNSIRTNGLKVFKQNGMTVLQRKKLNSDPYILFLIPKDTKKTANDYSLKDVLLLGLCIVICSSLFVFFVNRKKEFIQSIDLSQIALIGIFFICTSIYWSNLCLNFYSSPPAIENRSLTRKPNVDSLIFQPKKYFSAYSDWFADHFAFRQLLVFLNSSLKIRLFKTSPMPQKMYIGKNFEFFSANSLLTDDITNKRNLSQDELTSLFATTLYKQKYLSDQKIAYYLTIPPAKQTIYDECLPEYLSLQKKGMKMTQQFETEIEKQKANFYVDVISVLKNRHTRYPKEHVFFQFDLHWSDWGAFLAYRQLINTIYKDHPWVGRALNENEIKIDTVSEENADLAKLIVMQKTFKKERYIIRSKYSDTLSETVVNGVYQYPIYKYRNLKAKGRVLVFRDSYSEQWKWLIARHFNESIFIWDQNISQKLINEYKPDILIQENCEMFLFYLFNPIKANE